MADDDEEPTLFGPDGTIHAHARATDPRTSHEAAASITSDKIRASQDAVLRVLRRTGPICDAELVRVYQQRAADWPEPVLEKDFELRDPARAGGVCPAMQ